MTDPHLLMLYNEPILPRDHPDAAQEYEILETVERIRGILTKANFRISLLGVSTDPLPLIRGLREIRPDAVFNLFEGLANRGETEAAVAGLLEWMEIPFTGCPASAITIGRDKFRTKIMLLGAQLPTAPFRLIETLPAPIWEGEWPVIVKPALQDASVGIEQKSVATNQKQLNQRIAYVLENYGAPVLVEQFIHGREFLVGMLEEENATSPSGLTMLPLAEIVFKSKDKKQWPIYSYDAKWKSDSAEYRETPLEVPVILEVSLMNRIRQVAERAYRLIGCRDYARVDIRLSESGEPFILEVNPNPFLNSIAIIDGLESMNRQHNDFIIDLAWTALKRGGKSRPSVPQSTGRDAG